MHLPSPLFKQTRNKMHIEVAQGKWLRSTTRSVGIGGALLIYAAVFTWLAFHHHEREGALEVVSPVVTVMALLFAVPGYVLGIRQLRCGLWIDHDVVLVRGMFRTLRLAPNEVDGFKPEMRISPSPLLHRKHGQPIIVGALAHGGFSKARQAGCLRALEPVCDQLNALLASVQSMHPSRTSTALGMRPADHLAAYGSFRRFYISMTVVMAGIYAVAAVLLHTSGATVVVGSIALVQVAGTPIVLRLVRNDYKRKAQASSPAPSS
jgi:hypothetical protein